MYSTPTPQIRGDVSALQPDIKTPWDPGKGNSSKLTLSSILASAMQREDDYIDEEMTDDAKFGGLGRNWIAMRIWPSLESMYTS